MDSSGKTESIVAKAGGYWTPRLSPDGKRLALAVDQHSSQRNLYIYDLVRETVTRLTVDAEYQVNPVWTPDAEFILFRSGNAVASVRSDGTGQVQRMAAGKGSRWPWSISPDGKWLAFYQDDPETGLDLWTAPLERTPGELHIGHPEIFLRQAGAQLAPAISPDGHWVAYVSNESGRSEIYVMPFSPRSQRQSLSASAKSQVSSEGGFWPVWSRNGRNLFYKSIDNRVMVAACTSAGGSFAAVKPRVWADKQLGDPGGTPPFDVAPDGKRVVVLADVEESKPETHLRVLLHVGDELRRRASQTTK